MQQRSMLANLNPKKNLLTGTGIVIKSKENLNNHIPEMTGTRKFPASWGVGPTEWKRQRDTYIIISS